MVVWATNGGNHCYHQHTDRGMVLFSASTIFFVSAREKNVKKYPMRTYPLERNATLVEVELFGLFCKD
jgi:hypothetical protein